MSKSKALQKAPTVEQLQRELNRVRYRRKFLQKLCSTVIALLMVAAAVAAAVWEMPVLRVRGASMSPTLQEGDVLIALRSIPCGMGDIAAFSFGDRILVKRIAAFGGDVVDIETDGTVIVNGQALEEAYAVDPGAGELDLELPYRVPSGSLFVLGDNRAASVDSRSTALGSISQEQLIGRVVMRVWPFERFGWLSGSGAGGGEEAK